MTPANKRPMTIADHHASRLVADPLRLLDCCIETDGAVALIVTAALSAFARGTLPEEV